MLPYSGIDVEYPLLSFKKTFNKSEIKKLIILGLL
jgi:hypothetical protein